MMSAVRGDRLGVEERVEVECEEIEEVKRSREGE